MTGLVFGRQALVTKYLRMDYKKINRDSWNKRTLVHYESDFYNNKAFIAGAQSLNLIELELLGDLSGLKVLHLQCHFGQDTISLTRLGAEATGMDLSDEAIKKARELAGITNSNAQFVCCDLYELPKHLEQQFDLVFTSYGTIGWLPDLNRWAQVIAHFLKPGGRFIMAEFHPIIRMYDDDFTHVKYNYRNRGPIAEELSGTYTDPDAKIEGSYVCWNHGLAEVIQALLDNGMSLKSFQEFDYSPYDCVAKMEEVGPRMFRIKPFGDKIPLVYALEAQLLEQ